MDQMLGYFLYFLSLLTVGGIYDSQPLAVRFTWADSGYPWRLAALSPCFSQD